MRQSAFLMVLALMAPVVMDAQRSGGGEGPGRMGNSTHSIFAQHAVTSDTVEKLNPISGLVEKRKDLALTAAQITQLGGILARLDAKNAPLLRQLDSINTVIHIPDDGSSEESETDREHMQAYRSAVTQVLNNVRANDDSTGTEALALLSNDQRKKGADIVKDQRDKLGGLLRPGGPGLPHSRGGLEDSPIT